jgi:hypothetical protein
VKRIAQFLRWLAEALDAQDAAPREVHLPREQVKFEDLSQHRDVHADTAMALPWHLTSHRRGEDARGDEPILIRCRGGVYL